MAADTMSIGRSLSIRGTAVRVARAGATRGAVSVREDLSLREQRDCWLDGEQDVVRPRDKQTEN